MTRFNRLIALLMLVIGTFALANAQAGLGSLAGTVTDTQHSLINGATVTLTNPSTGFSATTRTINGEYRFFALEVASGYVLKVSAAGFKSSETKNLATSVGTTISANVTLVVGGQAETVEVNASNNVEQVQTETSAISQLIDSTVWKESPLEERTQNTFVLLTAGATPDSGTGRGASVDGARTGTGNYLVGGMDNNDQGLGGASTSGSLGGGGAVTTISPDAIEEYRVIAHNLPAEYGRAGGFATDTVLKSGSNSWHGSLFEYNRIQALAAENWFTKDGAHDALVRNQFGGSIGGRIFRDKTFFYATVEMQRRRSGSPETGTTTTSDFLNFVDSGAFETFMEGPNGICAFYTATEANPAGTQCPGVLSDAHALGPVFKSLKAAEPTAFPLGTQNATPVAAGLYTGGAIVYPVNIYATATESIGDALDQNRGSIKLDHKLTEKDQLSFAYLVDLFTDTSSNGAQGGSSFGPSGGTIGGAQNASITWTHTFTPSLLNIFRAGYLRHVNNVSAPGTAGVPEIYAANDPLNEGFGAYSGFPQFFTENEFLYQDSVTKTIKNHSFKTGFQYIRTRNGSSFYNDVSGTLLPWDTENLLTDATLYDQFETWLNGVPGQGYGSLYSASASIDPTTQTAPDPYRGYRANELSAYVQDDWKITKRLTLNLGIRWDYFGPPHNFKDGFDSNVYFGTFSAPTSNGNPFLPNIPLVGALQGANFQQRNSNIWNKDVTSFAPRFGFSYDVSGKGTFAIRGGFGIGYDRLYNNVYENIRFNYPHFSDNSIGYAAGNVSAGALLQPGLYQVPFTANAQFAEFGGKPVPRHIDQRLVNASYDQYNLGFEYQVARGYVLEMDYIGTLGKNLVGLDNINDFAGRTACPAGHTYGPTTPCGAAGYPNGFTTAHVTGLFNNDNFRTNAFSSNYNSFQASLRKGYANGLQFMLNYTWGKALDQTSDVFTNRNASTGPTNPYDVRYDYGLADFDLRQNIVLTGNYQSQWKKKNIILGGWSISPILKLESGTPFTPYDGSGTYNPIKDGRTGIDRTVYVGTGNAKNAINHHTSPANGYLKPISSGQYFGPYTCPPSQLWCEPPVGRNALIGPGLVDLDLGVSKKFQLFERQTLTFATNAFNVTNHPNFANPTADYNSSNYGLSLSAGSSRVLQMSLRYDF